MNVGDLVRLKNFDLVGTVTEVRGDLVWIVYPDKTWRLHKESLPAAVLEAAR